MLNNIWLFIKAASTFGVKPVSVIGESAISSVLREDTNAADGKNMSRRVLASLSRWPVVAPKCVGGCAAVDGASSSWSLLKTCGGFTAKVVFSPIRGVRAGVSAAAALPQALSRAPVTARGATSVASAVTPASRVEVRAGWAHPRGTLSVRRLLLEQARAACCGAPAVDVALRGGAVAEGTEREAHKIRDGGEHLRGVTNIAQARKT